MHKINSKSFKGKGLSLPKITNNSIEKYKRLNSEQIDRIIHILFYAHLDKPIKINLLEFETEFNNLSEIYDFEGWGDFKYILNNEKQIKLKKNSNGEFFGFSIGDWGRNVENSNGHIVFHSNLITKVFHIELGFCLQDEEFIYFTKKLFVRKGKGAMESYATSYNKIYNGYYNSSIPETFDKISPFNTLIEATNPEILNYDNSKWISLIKIEKSKLFNENYKNEILYNFLYDITHFLISLENILIGKKDSLIKEVKAQKSKRNILSSEDKKRIESAAMKFVKERWEQEGFPMKDVSDKRGEDWGYDFEAEGENTFYVEVKGTTVHGDWNIIMTKNEFNASEKYRDNYFLCIVQFDNKEDLNVKKYEKIQYPTKNENLQFEPYTYTVIKK